MRGRCSERHHDTHRAKRRCPRSTSKVFGHQQHRQLMATQRRLFRTQRASLLILWVPLQNQTGICGPKLPLHPEQSPSPIHIRLSRPSRQRRAGHQNSTHTLETTSHPERIRGLRGRGRQRHRSGRRKWAMRQHSCPVTPAS